MTGVLVAGEGVCETLFCPITYARDSMDIHCSRGNEQGNAFQFPATAIGSGSDQ